MILGDHQAMPLALPALSRAAALFFACAGLAAAAPPEPRFEDSLAQRVQACTACHGEQGRAGPDGYYPRIAGKPAGYLYNQLKHFQYGQRHHALMTSMVDPLSDAYLWEIAQHFAALHPPYPPALAARAPAAQLQRGEQLVRHGDATRQLPACVACHGTQLMGALPATPGLLGLPPDYINAQLGAWQTGGRKAHGPDCMADIARRLPATDVAAVSAWLATQTVPARAAPVAASTIHPPMECGSHTPTAAPTAPVRQGRAS